MQRLALIGVVAAATLSMVTGVASASTFTLGSTVEPSGSPTVNACSAAGIFAQSASDPSTLSTAPAGGQITQWQTNTAGETPGESIELVALTPQAGVFRIDAVDDETVPSPAGGVATFTPASPMMVSSGDILGLAGGTHVTCDWSGGNTPLTDMTDIFGTVSVNPGDAFSSLGSAPFEAVDLAATLVATEDSAVTTAVQPGTVAAGAGALLTSTVTDVGPASNALTFTDAVPAGLTIDAALSSAGPCATVGQVVTCTLSGLAAGQSAPVDIVVTAPAGTYTNSVTVAAASAVTDPVAANNTAAAAFTAAAPPAPAPPAAAKCVVTSLDKLPLATGKRLLAALGCTVGKVTKSYSSKVAKGDVIKTTPGSGSFTAPKSIAIVESRGPKPKKPKKHQKK